MIREPKTEPMPAPDPATPTVAAPAPMNLAAESMSLAAALVCRAREEEAAGEAEAYKREKSLCQWGRDERNTKSKLGREYRRKILYQYEKNALQATQYCGGSV